MGVKLKYDSSSGTLLFSCGPVKPTCSVLPKYNGFIHRIDSPIPKGKNRNEEQTDPR